MYGKQQACMNLFLFQRCKVYKLIEICLHCIIKIRYIHINHEYVLALIYASSTNRVSIEVKENI